MVELVFYEHLPSKAFLKERDVDHPGLREFIRDGVLFVVGSKAIEQRQKYNIGLAVYSRGAGKTLTVERVVLAGSAGDIDNRLDVLVRVDRSAEGEGIYTNSGASIRLFPLIDAADLAHLAGGGDLKLTVFCRIDGREASIDFVLTRRVERQIVFPT